MIEPRYFVLKLEDTNKYLDDDELMALAIIQKKVNDRRKEEGKEDLQGVFVGQDWGCFDEVTDLIEEEIRNNEAT